ncbi:hypothetical protein LIER_20860 [Lithospermum erythrorhizon]|uniref:HMA domain-containing protein n=1 Tax=Lithospermum erythrorhizon TaxID=34254 RepID=A0AAV3QQH0_LITER
MEYALAASKTFVLGLKLHCKGCEAKVKRKLLSLQGVHTVSIDSKKGHITITGTIDPPTIISLLEKYRKKAVLLWEQPPSQEDGSNNSINGENNSNEERAQIISKDPITIDHFDDLNVAKTIQQLSRGVKDLKEIEVTFSKTVKVVFNDNGKMELLETTNSITTGKDDKMVMNINNGIPTREEKTVIGTPYLCSGSCCGGKGGVQNFQGNHHCCCQFSGNIHNHNHHWLPPGVGYTTPLGRSQHWETSSAAPSAPPVHQYDYGTLPPSMGYYYPHHDQSVFSDDNPNGCVVM